VRSSLRAGLASALAAFALAAHADPEGHAAAPPAADAPRYDAPEPGTYALPPIHHLAQHRLLGPSGKPESLLALKPGELALVSFVYLSCGDACPLATALLHRLDGEIARQPDLAGKVELVTVSFDPARDTPAAMRELRDRIAPRGRWRFLTGADERALRPVLADFGQDAVWIPGEPSAPDALRHVLKVFVVDARGDVRQIYSTGFLDVRLVLADLRTLRAESSGTPPAPAS
jgi:cytochrome oxidase Cu insertion factor (SCO1/SenC/PrrC family)